MPIALGEWNAPWFEGERDDDREGLVVGIRCRHRNALWVRVTEHEIDRRLVFSEVELPVFGDHRVEEVDLGVAHGRCVERRRGVEGRDRVVVARRCRIGNPDAKASFAELRERRTRFFNLLL